MAGELGKASLDLSVDLPRFKREMGQAKDSSEGVEHALEAVASVARVAEIELNRVKMDAAQGARSSAIADRIERSIGNVGHAAMEAHRHLEQVKLDAAQAAETEAAGTVIDHTLNDITDNADQARRALERLRLAGVAIGDGGRRGRAVRTTGAGVGPFGSGFGRVGLLGTAIGVGAVTAPAAGPAALGLLAAIPALGAGAAGVIGTLVLAFKGLGKAIGGDKKAFDELEPAQQAFVQRIRSMQGWLGKLKETAASNLFPGLTAGLTAAFSPGTTALITRSVAQFGQAIGQAGAQWGRYFGSSQFQQSFGPLMQAGARNLGVIADAALHLFDALGVLGRAAIPLTNWITDSIDKGAQLASTWLRAQDASGALARGMTEAQSSIRLVGGLLVAAGRAVFALGEALYPVAKQAVKALTDGLNGLAGIIQRNQGAIREIVGAVLTGLVSAVKVAVEAVRLLNTGISHIVGSRAPTVTAILAIAAALAFLATSNPFTAIALGAVLAVGLIVRHWSQLKTFFGQLLTFLQDGFNATWTIIKGGAQAAAGTILTVITGAVRGVLEGLSHLPFGMGGPFKKALNGLKSVTTDWIAQGTATMKQGGEMWGKAFGDAFHKTAIQKFLDAFGTVMDQLAALSAGKIPGAGKPAKPPAATPVFGTPPPFTKNVPSTGSGTPSTSFELPFSLRLQQAKANVTASTNDDLRVAERISTYIKGLIAHHKLAGEKLISAYEALAGVTSTIAAAAQAAADKVRSFTVPLRLQVAQAKFEALGQAGNVRDVLLKIKAAAMAALKSGKLSLQAQLDAWNTIAQVNGQLKQTTVDKAAAVRANEAQFVTDMAALQKFRGNTEPAGGQGISTGMLETQGHEQTSELRRQSGLLARALERGAYPATGYSQATAFAVGG